MNRRRRLVLGLMTAAFVVGVFAARDGSGADAGTDAATKPPAAKGSAAASSSAAAAASAATPASTLKAAASCDQLEAAKNLTDPEALLTLGRCHSTRGKNTDAWRATREAVMYLQKTPPPDAGTQTAAENELDRLAHLVGVVIVRAECETQPVTVRVDGETVPSGRPIPLMPGAHKLDFACVMGEVHRDVTVRGGDKAEIEVPVDAWQKSSPDPKTPVRQPYGCGCEVVGL